jgi:hypothetical protein
MPSSRSDVPQIPKEVILIKKDPKDREIETMLPSGYTKSSKA